MSSELEIEYKNLVTKEEFMKLVHEFNIQQKDMVIQQNYYFDTPSFDIKNQKSALRIRRKKGKYELTLKQPVINGNWETNEELEEDIAQQMIKTGKLPAGEVKNILINLHIPVDTLSCFGSLTTNRAEIRYLDGLLVFDHSSYLNKEDYELEYEVKDRNIGEQHFRELLERFFIPHRATENKVVRFYREYKKSRSASSNLHAND
ncbi:CYTH domain-containing protein [Heyndrickxia camelliae]|uniref:CYTH domain-containing protein n=1 Tax=Heyndrickxia camelliae TaxID=1707093 RepID=A0A2N3LQ22_9BACI|nr:CYTH domain-containing protein [Heyndrickxia camelliae]PKR86772.1 CYTH domain-containing protein [Heyndrickxia camelliae]